MEKSYNILLSSCINKKATNENASINVMLSDNKKLLPEDGINDSLNAYDVYLNERKKSNKFRLIINLKPYCSNVLFNPFTEIIRNEGSENVICLNYLGTMATTSYLESAEVINGTAIIAKSQDFIWNSYEAIRDTQLSNNACGFKYHCGVDIFNNHILRNKTFKAVNFNEETSFKIIGKLDTAYGSNYSNVLVNDKGALHIYTDDDFNTIDDYMRDKDGWIISEHFPKILNMGSDITSNKFKNVVLPLHLYQKYDLMPFDDCVKTKLIEDNGWYGFSNPSVLSSINYKEGSHTVNVETTTFTANPGRIICGTYNTNIKLTAIKTTDVENLEGEKLSINKTINSEQYCDFIDMYPGRDLYSFNPKYNINRKRIEKNWNYCLTYPYKNIIRIDDGVTRNNSLNFPFFRIDENENVSLKVYMFDEGTYDDDGVAVLTIYSICCHGLSVGDTVNIYKSNELFYDAVEVVNVIDKYIFQVYKDTGNMSDEWIEVDNRYDLGGMYEHTYPICESNRCNIDPNAQDIHFRRVVNGVECKYYVRKFARIPNFKFKDEEVNDYTLYDEEYNSNIRKDNKIPLIQRFSNPGNPICDFENHISKLGFADTAYGDGTSEIVFTDDIDISYLRDNLGRPLSDVYFTIVKNNKGYKKWYGIDEYIDINSEDVEFSHCFGKLNGSFLLSDYFRESYLIDDPKPSTIVDVRDLTSNPNQAFSLWTITNDVSKKANYYDEIEFDRDWEYNGDICCYSPLDCDEQVLQNAMYRFNTVQRELYDIKGKALKYFDDGLLTYDEIKYDENTIPYSKTNEGDPYEYFKNNHSEKGTKKNLMRQREGYYYQPHYRIPFKTVSESVNRVPAIEYEIIEVKKNDNIFNIKIANDISFQKNYKLILYKRSSNETFNVTVYESLTPYRFTCTIYDENGKNVSNIEGVDDLSQINDFVILDRPQDVPYYAKILKDGSCRYCWREIISNGIENDAKIYPFTNGAFYVTKSINFFLRRQDPMKKNLGLINVILGEMWDYNPEGEDINNYPNFLPYYETNYDENEIETC